MIKNGYAVCKQAGMVIFTAAMLSSLMFFLPAEKKVQQIPTRRPVKPV